MKDGKNETIIFYVLIPVYKTEKYIRQCLDSVLNQTYQNYHVVVVDDGSPDQAGAICDEYAAQYKQIHVIHKENQGLISARRAAIDYVTENCNRENAFYVFLDSDDYLNPDALEVLADTISSQDCDMVVYGLQRVFEGEVLSLVDGNPFVGVITDKRTLYKRMFSNTSYNPLCRKAIHCQLIENIDYSEFYHISRGEDLLQDIPIYKKCKKVVFIKNVLYNYTVNPTSITQSITIDGYVVEDTVRAAVWNFLDTENVLTQEDKTQYLRFCCDLLKRELFMIGTFRAKRKQLKELYQQIKKDTYYSMLLNIESNIKILSLLKAEKYDWVVFYAKIRALLAKIKRKLVH